MGKKEVERRVYTKEFKAEAAALAEKREKPISHVVDFTPLSIHS
jgi:transposase-like protein